MKTISLLITTLSLAGTCAVAQPVIARGRVQLTGCAITEPLCKSKLVPMEQPARAGNSGTVLLYADGSRMRLSPGTEFTLYGGIPVKPTIEAPLEAPDATSAVKSILTRRDTQRYRNQTEQEVTHDGLAMRSGSLLVDERASAIDVRVLNAQVSGADSEFAVTMVSPQSARITVARGAVTLSMPGNAPKMIRPGEFITITSDASGRATACDPRLISESSLAMADQQALLSGLAGRLAPVGECLDPCDLEPVGELVGCAPAVFTGLPGVGTGPSVPFDLANPRILSKANEVNVSGPVQSPERP